MDINAIRQQQNEVFERLAIKNACHRALSQEWERLADRDQLTSRRAGEVVAMLEGFSSAIQRDTQLLKLITEELREMEAAE